MIVHSPISIATETPGDLWDVYRLLEFNYKIYRRLHFPEYTGEGVPLPVLKGYLERNLWEWVAVVPDELILDVPLDSTETLRADIAREFEEANPGVEYPFYWVQDELFHKEDKALS